MKKFQYVALLVALTVSLTSCLEVSSTPASDLPSRPAPVTAPVGATLSFVGAYINSMCLGYSDGSLICKTVPLGGTEADATTVTQQFASPVKQYIHRWNDSRFVLLENGTFMLLNNNLDVVETISNNTKSITAGNYIVQYVGEVDDHNALMAGLPPSGTAVYFLENAKLVVKYRYIDADKVWSWKKEEVETPPDLGLYSITSDSVFKGSCITLGSNKMWCNKDAPESGNVNTPHTPSLGGVVDGEDATSSSLNYINLVYDNSGSTVYNDWKYNNSNKYAIKNGSSLLIRTYVSNAYVDSSYDGDGVGVAKVAGNSLGFCAVLLNGDVYCWGRFYNLYNNDPITQVDLGDTPVKIPEFTGATELHIDGYTPCAEVETELRCMTENGNIAVVAK
jgi:hypothetical protein